MPSISKRGDRWLVRWRDVVDGGVVERTRSFKSQRLARALLREVEHDVALGRPWSPRVARRVPLLGDAMMAFIEDRARTLAPFTLMRYSRTLTMFARFVDDDSATLETLTKQGMVGFFGWLMRAENGLHGHQRAPATAAKLVEIVQNFWKWCAEHDEYVEHVGAPRKIELPRAAPAFAVAPTWAEMAAAVHACRGWQKHLAVVIYATGLRCNQAMRLEWRDVDLEHRRLVIRPELGKMQSEKRGRVVPIPAWLADELATWGTRDGFVIKSGRTGQRERIARPREMDAAWARAGVRPEVWQGRPHHAFRKGYVSGLKKAGADDEAVEFLVGHSLGLRDVYRDPEALPLVEAVALVPSPWSFGRVVALKEKA
jgi:integrase